MWDHGKLITRDTYNRTASDWDHDHQDDTWWQSGTEAFIRMLRPGNLVLDAGCGSGIKSKYLVARGLRVIGIDFAEKFIAMAQDRVPEAEFRLADMQYADRLPEEFDGIFAQASLLHIPRIDMLDVVRALVSRLKYGGFFYAAVKGPREGGPLEEMKTEDDLGYKYTRFFSYHSCEDLRGYLEGAGLAIEYEYVARTGKTDWIQMVAQKM